MTNDTAGKHRFGWGVFELNDEGKHLGEHAAVLCVEVETENVSERLDRVGFSTCPEWDAAQRACLGGVDYWRDFARIRRDGD